MTAIPLHPALSRLLRVQAYAKARRICERFRSPRKFALSMLALVLALVWLGNAVISILFRDPYPIETMRSFVPLLLTAYALWHVVKVAGKRPEEPIEWSPAEREMVCGGPFSRKELLTYRLTTVMTATLLKALCASVLLIPDLPVWPAGFVGFLLAFTFVELLRMALEIGAYSINNRAYLLIRVVVLGTVSVTAIAAFIKALNATTASGDAVADSSVALLVRFVQTLADLRHTGIGRIVEAPFAAFGNVITAPQAVHWEFCGWLLLAGLMVAMMAVALFWIDRICRQALVDSEQARYCPSNTLNATTDDVAIQSESRLPRVRRLGGIGPLAWRQMIGASQHKLGLLAAVAAPALLSQIPLLYSHSASGTYLQVAANALFYSFVLLPAAFKFDFRCDYDRLTGLKMLPMPPSTIVFGQLATPVVLISLFQLAVLGFAAVVQPVSLGYLIASVALLLPLNVLIFSTENYIFMLSPYRLNQEGIDVVVRTILVFTAKGILFALALVLFFVWSFAASRLTAMSGGFVSYGIFFFSGIWIAVCAMTFAVTKLLIRAFRRFDPSLDVAS